jgi:hypothetical protein
LTIESVTDNERFHRAFGVIMLAGWGVKLFAACTIARIHLKRSRLDFYPLFSLFCSQH